MNCDIYNLQQYIESIVGSYKLTPIKLHLHIRAIIDIKINHTNEYLITIAKDKTPNLWSIKTGEHIGMYEGHEGVVWDCDIKNDSTLLITGSADQTTRLWNFQTGKLLKTFEFESSVRCVKFNNNNFLVVTDNLYNESPKIILYENTVDYKNEVIYTSDILITSAIFNNDGSYIFFSNNNGDVSIFDVIKRSIIITKNIHPNYNCKNIKFDKEYTTLITSSNDCTAKLLDPRNLNIIKTYKNTFPINCSLITNNYIILSGGIESASVTTSSDTRFDIVYYSKIFEDRLGSFTTHFGNVNCLTISDDETILVSGGDDGIIYIYHIEKTN